MSSLARRNPLTDMLRPVPWRGMDRAILIGLAAIAVANFVIVAATLWAG